MEPTATTQTQTTNGILEDGVRYFRAQGQAWHTAAESAAESAIKSIGIDASSTDAFSLRAAFASTARGLAAAERGL